MTTFIQLYARAATEYAAFFAHLRISLEMLPKEFRHGLIRLLVRHYRLRQLRVVERMRQAVEKHQVPYMQPLR